MGAFDPVIIVTNAGGGTLARRLAPPLHALACGFRGKSPANPR